MSESFLYYIWQYQYFTKTDLSTGDADAITVFSPGIRNQNAGPDFINARIKIDDMEWVGSVEIHIHSSDWVQHKHGSDEAYDNVILHVVWKNDQAIYRRDGTLLPCLELKDRIAPKLLLQYKKLVNSPEEISCANLWSGISELTKLSMLDKALANRLEHKALDVINLLKRNNHSWEETSYQLLAKNFGFKVNADPFFQLALQLPYKIILKHADKILQVEALLYGQAGFLEKKNGNDEYYRLLAREYTLLKAKHELGDKRLNVAQWKFLRLRPANFPTVRLAQFAMLLYKRKNIFSGIIEASSYTDFQKLFSVQQSEYWCRHYQFEKAAGEVPSLGQTSIDNVIINTVAPLLVAYGKLKDDQVYVDRALEILQQMPSENNAITKRWHTLDWKSKTAFDSQAFIELYNNFCSKRRCLDCNIGTALLKPVLKE